MEQRTEPKLAARKVLDIRVLGVGGAGCNAVNHLAREPLDGVSFAVLNTEVASLEGSVVGKKLLLGSGSTRGLGAGGDPDLGRAAAEADLGQLAELCEGAEIVFVVAGLGGGTGTGAAPVVAQIAKESGALVLGIVLLPFDCEGARRLRQAQVGLHELKVHADGVICLPNQRMFKLVDEKTSLVEGFQMTNELVAEGVRGIWRLLTQPGLINITFADLCSVTRGRHAESALATVLGRGENRAREVMEKLMDHPLVEGGQALTEASAVLVSIAGGPGLTMAEVNRIMEQINRQAEQATVVMGASVSEELGDGLSVTLVASCRGNDSVPTEDRPSGSDQPSSFQEQLEDPKELPRPASRFVPPPPEMTAEQREKLLAKQSQGNRGRRNGSRLRQGQLPLEIVSKGRFEKSEPTIHHGQDLDVPTYIRRGVALN